MLELIDMEFRPSISEMSVNLKCIFEELCMQQDRFQKMIVLRWWEILKTFPHTFWLILTRPSTAPPLGRLTS